MRKRCYFERKRRPDGPDDREQESPVKATQRAKQRHRDYSSRETLQSTLRRSEAPYTHLQRFRLEKLFQINALGCFETFALQRWSGHWPNQQIQRAQCLAAARSGTPNGRIHSQISFSWHNISYAIYVPVGQTPLIPPDLFPSTSTYLSYWFRSPVPLVVTQNTEDLISQPRSPPLIHRIDPP